MNKREMEKKLLRLNKNIEYYKKVYPKSEKIKEYKKMLRINKKYMKKFVDE